MKPKPFLRLNHLTSPRANACPSDYFNAHRFEPPVYGAVCDDTVGFFAVLTKDEPNPPRIERAFGVETRWNRGR